MTKTPPEGHPGDCAVRCEPRVAPTEFAVFLLLTRASARNGDGNGANLELRAKWDGWKQKPTKAVLQRL
jgi:hypothetical protein